MVVLDYFCPHTRSPLCLHATLAAAHVLLTAPGAPAALTVTTAMHGQALQLVRNAAGLFIGLAPQPAPANGGGSGSGNAPSNFRF